MHGNRLWVAFLVIVLGLACYFSARAGVQVYHYARLDSHTTATVSDLRVERLGKDRYGLDATYSYEVAGHRLQRVSPVPNKIFRNNYAAEKGKIGAAAAEWHAWYSSKNPDIASLERAFPLKSCIYAVVVLGILAYLLMLGRKMTNLQDLNPES